MLANTFKPSDFPCCPSLHPKPVTPCYAQGAPLAVPVWSHVKLWPQSEVFQWTNGQNWESTGLGNSCWSFRVSFMMLFIEHWHCFTKKFNMKIVKSKHNQVLFWLQSVKVVQKIVTWTMLFAPCSTYWTLASGGEDQVGMSDAMIDGKIPWVVPWLGDLSQAWSIPYGMPGQN